MTLQNTLRTEARLAGLIYLVIVITGIFALGYIPSQIGGSGDTNAMLQHLRDMVPLFKLGAVAFMAMQVAFIILPLQLYRLFHKINPAQATLMVVFALCSIPTGLIALAEKLTILSLATNPNLAALGPQQVVNAAQLALIRYDNALFVTTLFWGLWLLPFGGLVYRSGFIPRVLGVLLILGGFSYLVDMFSGWIWPAYAGSLAANLVTLPASLGEFGICLWLLVIGVRAPKAPPPVAA